MGKFTVLSAFVLLGVQLLICQIESAHVEPQYQDSIYAAGPTRSDDDKNTATAYGALPPENYCMRAPSQQSQNGARSTCGGYSNYECDNFCYKYGFRNGWCGHASIDALKKKYCLCHNGTCDTGYLRD